MKKLNEKNNINGIKNTLLLIKKTKLGKKIYIKLTRCAS